MQTGLPHGKPHAETQAGKKKQKTKTNKQNKRRENIKQKKDKTSHIETLPYCVI